jgi:rod shape-determining protein MreC
MQRIIYFIIKYKIYFTYISLTIISLSLISLGDSGKIGGFRAVVIGSIGWFQNTFSWIPNPVALKNENQALRELNLKLSSDVTKMQHSLLENEKLRDIIGFKKRMNYDYEIAEIVGRITTDMRYYVTLNKGAKNGILTGMSVRNDAGLVGLIIATTDNYSAVELVTNRNVKISAKNIRSGVYGIVDWQGGNFFNFNNIPRSFDLKIGDLIVTSNFSNKYPDDIPLGEVVRFYEEKGEQFLNILLNQVLIFLLLNRYSIKKIPA